MICIHATMFYQNCKGGGGRGRDLLTILVGTFKIIRYCTFMSTSTGIEALNEAHVDHFHKFGINDHPHSAFKIDSHRFTAGCLYTHEQG